MTKPLLLFYRNLGRLLLIAIILTLLFFVSLTGMRAEEGTQLVFDPTIVDLPAAAVTVTVRIENVTNLYGLELEVLFDPTIVTVEAIAPADFLSADFVVFQKIDIAAGRASLAYTQLAPQLGRNGSGNIATLRIKRTSCMGQSPLKLSKVVLSSKDGQAIPYSVTEAEATSGVALTDRQISGIIFHDMNEDGQPTGGEPLLGGWPIFLQRLAVDTTGPERFTLSQPTGAFRFDDLACGRYQLWTQNSELSVLTQTIDLPATTDIGTVSLPLTGTLEYPLQQLFIPLIGR